MLVTRLNWGLSGIICLSRKGLLPQGVAWSDMASSTHHRPMLQLHRKNPPRCQCPAGRRPASKAILAMNSHCQHGSACQRVSRYVPESSWSGSPVSEGIRDVLGKSCLHVRRRHPGCVRQGLFTYQMMLVCILDDVHSKPVKMRWPPGRQPPGCLPRPYKQWVTVVSTALLAKWHQDKYIPEPFKKHNPEVVIL